MPPNRPTHPATQTHSAIAIRSARRTGGSCYSSRFLSPVPALEVSVRFRHPGPWTFGVATILAVLPLAGAALRGQTARANRVVALRGGTILTITKGTITNGTVLLRDGKV